MLSFEVIQHVSTMAEIVAQGGIYFMKIQGIEAQGDLFGSRALFKERNDAFQSDPCSSDSDNPVSVFAQRRGFAFEGQLHCLFAQGSGVIGDSTSILRDPTAFCLTLGQMQNLMRRKVGGS